MSDFKQAIEWSEKGNKLKSSAIKEFNKENEYIYLTDDGFFISHPNQLDYTFSIKDFKATDWEIFEDFPPLKICPKCGLTCEDIPERKIISLCNCKESLSEKYSQYYNGFQLKDVKEKIQNAQKRLKEEDEDWIKDIIALIEINNYGKEDLLLKMKRLCKAHKEEKEKIFKEEFGDKILK